MDRDLKFDATQARTGTQGREISRPVCAKKDPLVVCGSDCTQAQLRWSLEAAGRPGVGEWRRDIGGTS